MNDTPQPRQWAWEIDYRDTREGTSPDPYNGIVALACMDGSWWVNWDRLPQLRAWEIENQTHPNPSVQATVCLCDLLLAARGQLREVSFERADEIAREYGARNNPLGFNSFGVVRP